MVFIELEKKMGYDKKMNICKYMFLVSTFSGIVGTYLLYKQLTVLGWIFVSMWAVIAVVVRILIIMGKIPKNKK